MLKHPESSVVIAAQQAADNSGVRVVIYVERFLRWLAADRAEVVLPLVHGCQSLDRKTVSADQLVFSDPVGICIAPFLHGGERVFAT